MIFIMQGSLIAGGGNSLSVVGGGVVVQGAGSATFGVTMTNDAEVEGFVVALSFDSSSVSVTDVSTSGSVTESSGAELIVPEILAGGFTLGCVLDAAAPFDGQTIGAGTDQLLMEFTVQSNLILNQGDPNVSTGFEFVDGNFNNPPLSNIVVIAGQSVGAGSGLGLNGDVTAMGIAPPPPATLTIENGVADSSGQGSARILLENSGETQGFVLSVGHDGTELTLDGIDLAGTETESAGAEFTAIETYTDGGTIGVVLDFNFPFDGQTVPAGNNLHIANYNYSDSVDVYIDGDAVPADQIATLAFVDGSFGAPALNNVVVSGGLSISPDYVDGSFTTQPVA
ncbi:hypothetical protein OAP77_01640, partial [Planctomycetota bacterium]|nr:hypothetical protein [Planctomycetota bacterium]